MTFNHILVTTDFSVGAEAAIPAVVELANRLSVRVTALHVVHTIAIRPVGAALAPPLSMPIDADALALARRRLPDWVQERFGSVEVACVTAVGTDIADTIAAQAKLLSVDLVVMSTHGRTGLESFFLGSVTERVLKRATVPVLCVPIAGRANG